jgi:fluoroquinolone resistance protein
MRDQLRRSSCRNAGRNAIPPGASCYLTCTAKRCVFRDHYLQYAYVAILSMDSMDADSSGLRVAFHSQLLYVLRMKSTAAPTLFDTTRAMTTHDEAEADPFAAEEFENATFANVSARGGVLRGKTFTRCHFKNCDLSGANLSGSLFENCTFTDCNVSLVIMNDAKMRGVTFTACKILGVVFSQCNTLSVDMNFTKCMLRNCNFSELTLRKMSVRQCEIIDSDFINVDLTGADFSDSSFTGSEFNNANLTRASFIDARGYAINPLSNKIKKAQFSMPEAISLVEYLGVVIK